MRQGSVLVCGLIASFLFVGFLCAVQGRAGPTMLCRRSYSYAGLQGSTPVAGIRANLKVLAWPHVNAGHVAGWIGVGGPGQGPGGSDQWLQVGYSAFPDGTVQTYYEVALPTHPPEYHAIESRARLGETRLLSLREVEPRSAGWQVWLEGTAVSPVYALAGNDGRYVPQGMGESWSPSGGPCNAYAWRFGSIRVATRPGGSWTSAKVAREWHDTGYRVRLLPPDSFEALSR